MANPIKIEFKLPNTNVECCIQCRKEAMVTAIIEDKVQNGLCCEHFESLVNGLNNKGINNNSKEMQEYFNKQKEQQKILREKRCIPLSKY